jgi:hypothetical protein
LESSNYVHIPQQRYGLLLRKRCAFDLRVDHVWWWHGRNVWGGVVGGRWMGDRCGFLL